MAIAQGEAAFDDPVPEHAATQPLGLDAAATGNAERLAPALFAFAGLVLISAAALADRPPAPVIHGNFAWAALRWAVGTLGTLCLAGGLTASWAAAYSTTSVGNEVEAPNTLPIDGIIG